jgi:hypothetical protein
MQFYFPSLLFHVTLLLILKCALLTCVDQVNCVLDVLSMVTVILWDVASFCLIGG